MLSFIIFKNAVALVRLENGQPPESPVVSRALHLLKLGGYGFHLTTCLMCVQEPAPPLYFSIPRGGLVCGACHQGAASPLAAINPGVRKLMQQAQEMQKELLPRLIFPPRQRDQCLALIRAFLRYHLGRELKSWSFWDKVISGREAKKKG